MTDGSNAPKPDLSEVFDLDRRKAVTDFVNGFTDLYRRVDAVNTEIRQLADEANIQMFTAKEIAAMKRVAKIKLKNDEIAAKEQLAALKRVSNALGADLFSWADQHQKA